MEFVGCLVESLSLALRELCLLGFLFGFLFSSGQTGLTALGTVFAGCVGVIPVVVGV